MSLNYPSSSGGHSTRAFGRCAQRHRKYTVHWETAPIFQSKQMSGFISAWSLPINVVFLLQDSLFPVPQHMAIAKRWRHPFRIKLCFRFPLSRFDDSS